MMISTILSGCSLSTDQVNITKEEAAESVTQVKVDLKFVDLKITESADSNAHASVTGLKASQDDAMLDMIVKGSILEVKAALVEGSFVDLNKETLNNEAKIKLTLSLPKKQYNRIQVQVNDPDSTIELVDENNNEKKISTQTTSINSIFGTINMKR